MVANLHEFGGTPKKKKPRTTKYRNNWRLQIGGHGPIEIGPLRMVKRRNQRVLSRVYFAKLNTARMVAKSKSIAADAEAMLIAERLNDDETIAAIYGNNPKYPPRPFMGPALIKAQPYLPQMWRNSIKNS